MMPLYRLVTASKLGAGDAESECVGSSISLVCEYCDRTVALLWIRSMHMLTGTL